MAVGGSVGGPADRSERSEANDASGTPSRRSFLSRAWLALGGIAVAEYAWLVFEFLRPRKTAHSAETGIVIAGPVDQFEPGSVTAFPEGKFYLARLEDGRFLALHRECTHLGCTVPWIVDEGRFVCPCHASAYDITGSVLNPPAPRPLDLFRVRIENRTVKVDVSRPVKRQSFEPGQATRV